MIQSNELRLGNIFWESYGGYYVVTAIGCNMKGDAPDTVCARHIRGNLSGQYDCALIEPIPLSPEILKKCGFEWTIYHQAFHKNDFKFNLNAKIDNEYSLDSYRRLITICDSIKYLHQLQNIFFCLSGEELQIKL